jgi:transposase
MPMGLAALFPHFTGLRLVRHELFDDELLVELVPRAATARCPDCHRRSHRVHSRYTRRVADQPIGGRRVSVHLRVRRFFCRAPTCRRVTFTEQAPALVARYARRSVPLQADVRDIGLTLGGRPGHRFAARRAITISRTTLLRLVRALPEPARGTPRVLGIDEFAFRRGRTYGCLLVDLETHRPVDVLPEKSAAAVIAWLGAHGGVEVICRDRCSLFAEAATRGAPAAVQVVDRFHLLRNLGDAVEAVVARHPACLLDEAGDVVGVAAPSTVSNAACGGAGAGGARAGDQCHRRHPRP